MIYINNIFPLKGERWFPRLYGMCLPPTTVHFSIAPGYSIWVSYISYSWKGTHGVTQPLETGFQASDRSHTDGDPLAEIVEVLKLNTILGSDSSPGLALVFLPVGVSKVFIKQNDRTRKVIASGFAWRHSTQQACLSKRF